MSEFRDPDIGIHKVYTRGGDRGDTSLVDGTRIAKDHARIEAYGAVDELNSIVGLCRIEALEHDLADLATALLKIQHQLFNLGSILATPTASQGENQPRIQSDDVDWLEHRMDQANGDLPALTSFVLPGGSRLNGLLHLARTVCRRAERRVVHLDHQEVVDPVDICYLNRLSDALFVWARAASHALGDNEVLWAPNEG